MQFHGGHTGVGESRSIDFFNKVSQVTDGYRGVHWCANRVPLHGHTRLTFHRRNWCDSKPKPYRWRQFHCLGHIFIAKSSITRSFALRTTSQTAIRLNSIDLLCFIVLVYNCWSTWWSFNSSITISRVNSWRIFDYDPHLNSALYKILHKNDIFRVIVWEFITLGGNLHLKKMQCDRTHNYGKSWLIWIFPEFLYELWQNMDA